MIIRSIAILAVAALSLGTSAAPYTAVPNVINASATDWAQAARTGLRRGLVAPAAVVDVVEAAPPVDETGGYTMGWVTSEVIVRTEPSHIATCRPPSAIAWA